MALGRAILRKFSKARPLGRARKKRAIGFSNPFVPGNKIPRGLKLRISLNPGNSEVVAAVPAVREHAVAVTPTDSAGESELMDALRSLAKIKAELKASAKPAGGAEDGISVGEFIQPGETLRRSFEGFILDQRSVHTQRAYGADLKRFAKYLIARSLSQGRDEIVGRSVIVGFKDWLLTEGLEHTTVDRQLATLRSVFAWLVEEGWMPRNPAEKVRFLNPRRISRTIGFSDEEVRRMLAIPDLHTRTGAQHYAILMVLFYCGLRRSEICALRTSNLTIERGHPVLRLKGKGNRERIVVLRKEAWNAVKYHLHMSRRDPARDSVIFSPQRNNRTGTRDKALDPSMIFYIVTRYAKKAGIQSRVSPHSCRATAISNARDHKVPDRAIQEFAGWSSPAMIIHYDKRRTAVEESAAHAISYGAEERKIPPWLKDDSEWPATQELTP